MWVAGRSGRHSQTTGQRLNPSLEYIYDESKEMGSMCWICKHDNHDFLKATTPV